MVGNNREHGEMAGSYPALILTQILQPGLEGGSSGITADALQHAFLEHCRRFSYPLLCDIQIHDDTVRTVLAWVSHAFQSCPNVLPRDSWLAIQTWHLATVDAMPEFKGGMMLVELFKLIDAVKKDLADGKLTQAEIADLLKKLASFLLAMVDTIPDKTAKAVTTMAAGLLDKIADIIAAGSKLDVGYVITWAAGVLTDVGKLVEAVDKD